MIYDNANAHKNLRTIRSYVLRQGRMTAAQTLAFNTHWDTYGINFKDSFNIENYACPRILEIGFGMGDSLFEQTKNNPDAFFIGIEVHQPGIGNLLKQCEKEKISNIRIFRHDAVEILKYKIPDHALDKIQIFFPDPWQKNRHHKRRLIQIDFVKLCHQKLKLHGILHIATDWENYADHIRQVLTESRLFSFREKNIVIPYERPETKFESRGKKLGHGIWDFVVEARLQHN